MRSCLGPKIGLVYDLFITLAFIKTFDYYKTFICGPDVFIISGDYS